MAGPRLIARLDVKGSDLIKGIHLEGVRKVGNPNEFALRYYENGIDEIIYIDSVASLYGRNNLSQIVQETVERIFIPITVGGGVRSVEDARHILTVGADKIAVNTEATRRPELIKEIAETFGSQCMVLSIQARQAGPGKWQAFRDLGRDATGLDVVEWAVRGQDLGAGEILLTSVDREGTCSGFDIDLIRTVAEAVRIPVIASGGMGSTRHMLDAFQLGKADAIAMAHVLHFEKLDSPTLRASARDAGIPVRPF